MDVTTLNVQVEANPNFQFNTENKWKNVDVQVRTDCILSTTDS